MAFLKPQNASLECKAIKLYDLPYSLQGDGAEIVRSFFDDKQIPCVSDGSLRIETAHSDARDLTYIESLRRVTDEKYHMTIREENGRAAVSIRFGGTRSLFYALCDLYRRICTNTLFPGTIENYPQFAIRGYIEGFYGQPWTMRQRPEMLRTLAPCGINAYFYAPKDDPYHRANWQAPYPERDLDALKALADCAEDNYIDFWYCLAPGLDILYSDAAQFESLCRKYRQLYGIGIRRFGLLLDDIPSELQHAQDIKRYPDIVHAHADLANRLLDTLHTWDKRIRLTVCPMQYHGKADEYYISKLGHLLSPEILLFWTGRNICSQEQTVPEAIIFREHTLHRPLYWDNYPVNDAEMSHQMHLGAIRGREAQLPRYCEGLVANCMPQFECSKFPLLTIADYLWNSEQYDPQQSERDAMYAVLGQDAERFRYFAEHLHFSCLQAPLSPKMVEAFTAVDWAHPFDKQIPLQFEAYVRGASDCRDWLASRKGSQLYNELSPWIEKYECFCEILQLCASYFAERDGAVLKHLRARLADFERMPEQMTDFTFRACIETLLQSAKEVNKP